MGTAVDQIFSDLRLEEGGQNTVLAYSPGCEFLVFLSSHP